MQTPIVGVELLILFMKKALAQTIINPNDIISIQSVKGNLFSEKGIMMKNDRSVATTNN